MIPGNFLSYTTETVDPNASGWAPKLNCTIGLGSGGRNGDGVLKMTSTASGDMQARTFSSYLVTAGELYYTLADTSSSTQAERIGIRWLDAAAAEISVTWSLTTAAASSTWHRVSVAGVAPVGAVRAQVLLSATAGASARLHYWENVYFGHPIRRAGASLLSFNAEAGGELDTTAWGVGSNCTVSRVVPVTTWAVDYFYAGGHQVALTVTANGNADILCVERPPVTPGVDYAAQALLNPPTSGSAAWVELRFYNAAGTQVAATRSTLAAPGTGFYSQIASAVAPSDAATASIAVGITGATAGQIVRADGMFLGTARDLAGEFMLTGSVIPMADWGFEQGVGTWTVASGVGTLSRSTPWGTHGRYGSYALLVTSSTATATVVRSVRYPIGATAGQNWRADVLTKVVAGGWNYTIGFRWYDASNSLLSTDTGSSGPANTPNWWSRWVDFDAPANATQVQVELTLTATATSSVLALDGLSMRQTLPLFQVEGIQETASTRLILRELEPGKLLTVWRVNPDGTRRHVRGPDGLFDGTYVIPSDSLLVEDYEVPLGVQVSYRMQAVWDDGTSREDRDSDPVTVAPPDDPDLAWLTDPARPGVGLAILVATAPDWKQPIEQTVFRIRGRAAPVVLSDVRGSREGDLTVWTRTDEEREAMRFLLSTGNPLLWRCPPGRGETDVYVAVGETSAPRDTGDAEDPWRVWTLPLTELDMPTGSQAGSATWTVWDVIVEYGTGNDVLDNYATVFDLTTNNRRA